MPNNDYRVIWDVSKFDWREVKKRFMDRIPYGDENYWLNYNLNRTSFYTMALILDLNRRIEELEYLLKNKEEK